MNKIKLLIVGSVLVMLLSCICYAIPPVPAEFYGWVIVDGRYARQGTRIAVYDGQGVLCGETKIEDDWMYGLLSCAGDDPSTTADEGAIEGEGLIFFVDGTKIKTENSVYWESGSLREVNLIVGDIDRALPLLEQPKSELSEGLYLVFLILILLVAAIMLAIITRKIWKSIEKLREETELLKLNDL